MGPDNNRIRQTTADLTPRSIEDPDVVQDFGDRPLEVRETDHYVAEYVTGFVEKWDELIDWKRRAESEGSFFIDQL